MTSNTNEESILRQVLGLAADEVISVEEAIRRISEFESVVQRVDILKKLCEEAHVILVSAFKRSYPISQEEFYDLCQSDAQWAQNLVIAIEQDRLSAIDLAQRIVRELNEGLDRVTKIPFHNDYTFYAAVCHARSHLEVIIGVLPCCK